jgi:sulfate adenylyltransferase
LHIEDIWPVEKEKEILQIYGTKDKNHPGVQYINASGDYYIGGKLEAINLPLHFDFKQLRMGPQDIRNTIEKLKWQRTVGFSTRNAIHRAQYELTLQAMRNSKANLLLLPIVGITKPEDFNYYTRVRSYRKILSHYPPDSVILNLLPLAMRLAGSREALLHAILAKNYGCTHFIVGHNHAGQNLSQPEKSARVSAFRRCLPPNQ